MSKPKRIANQNSAKRLKYFRKKKGYSQEYIAEMLELKNAQMVSKYERGKVAVPLSKEEKYATILGVSSDILFSLSGAEESEILNQHEKECKEKEDSARLFLECVGFGFEYDTKMNMEIVFGDQEVDKSITGPYHVQGHGIDIYCSLDEIDKIRKSTGVLVAELLKR